MKIRVSDNYHQRIHVWFTYIAHKNQPNVGKYTSPMGWNGIYGPGWRLESSSVIRILVYRDALVNHDG